MATQDSRITWRIINELLSKKSNSSSVKEVIQNDKSICDPSDISKAFNEHFASIGPKLISEIPANHDSLSHLDYINATNCRFELRETSVAYLMFLRCYLSCVKRSLLVWINYLPDFFVNQLI